MERLAVARGHQREHTARGVGRSGGFSRQMRGDAADVFHHCRRIFEDVMVEALKNEPLQAAGLRAGDAVGVIDVAAAKRIGLRKFAGNFELAHEGAQVGESSSGFHGASIYHQSAEVFQSQNALAPSHHRPRIWPGGRRRG